LRDAISDSLPVDEQKDCVFKSCFLKRISRYTSELFPLLRVTKIESSPVWETSCLAELIYNLINRQLLWECRKPVTIQYLPPDRCHLMKTNTIKHDVFIQSFNHSLVHFDNDCVACAYVNM